MLKIQDILKSDLLPVLTGLYEDPHIITDTKGNIFFSNSPARELLNLTSSDHNIFDIFSGQTSEMFYSILRSRAAGSQPLEVQLIIKGKEAGMVQLKYSYISNASEEFFSFVFIPEDLKIKNGNGLKLSAGKNINIPAELLESVKQLFPFTLAGKDLLRRKADELPEFFWIKDVDGKYLLVNKAFCDYLGLPREKIEGTEEEKYVPEHLRKISVSIFEYIINTGKGFQSSGLLAGPYPYGRARIEIPLTNKDNKVYALVGITVPADPKTGIAETDFLKALPGPSALLGLTGTLMFANDQFLRLFAIDRNDSKISYRNYLPGEIYTIVDDFISSKYEDKSHILTGIDFLRKRGIPGFKLVLKRINLQKEDYILLYFNELNPVSEMQDSSSSRGKVYDILIQKNPEPVFIYEKENLRFIEVNQAALNLYGFSKTEFLQMDLTDLYAPEDIQTLLSALNESIQEGVFTGPFRQKKKNGSFVFVEISKFTLKYGNKDAHFNIIRDVTPTLETEKQIRLLQTAFDNTEQLVFVTDPMGFIISVNNRVIRNLGYTDIKMEKTSFAALVKDEERSSITGIFKTLKMDSKQLSIEIKNSSGQMVPVSLTISPVKDYKNEIEAFTILGNIVKKEEIKTSVQEPAIEKLLSTDKQSQGDLMLISSIFHEILTPINVILGFVQELTDSIGELTPDQKEAADIIGQNRTSLLNTMNSIVEYYNIEKKAPELDVAKISAKDLIDNLQNDFDELTRSRGIEILKGNISPSLSIETDKSKFANLLYLLAKISGYLTKEKKIYISLYPLGSDKFAVAFKNNPQGITPFLFDELVKIFSPGGMNNTTSGLPKLSLRLATRLLNIFNAELFVSPDNTEVGYTFPVKYKAALIDVKTEVSQPAEETKVPEKELKTIKKPAVKSPAEKETYLKLSRFKCLYIEDQIDAQILFKVQMKELGDLQFASSFEEALPLMDKTQFDFIVMDINLQGEYNGLDALRIIQKMPEHQNIPVIAATAYYLPGDRNNYIAAGFNEFIAKPIFRDKMVEILEKVFKTK